MNAAELVENRTLESDTVLFERSDIAGAYSLRVVRATSGMVWIIAADFVAKGEGTPYTLVGLHPGQLRQLADALAPFRTPEPKTYHTDNFCHVCGSKTVENKPVNNAPTFLAPRHAAFAEEE